MDRPKRRMCRYCRRRYRHHYMYPRYSSRSRPLLIRFLPQEGFIWVSKFEKPFVTNRQARHITKSMIRSGKKLDRDVTATYLTNLFFVARQLVGRCRELQPDEFWGEVGSHLHWARSISGSELHDFSNRILSARNSFNDRVQFYREIGREPEAIPEEYRARVNDKLHQAMDDWIYYLIKSHGRYSEIRQLYYPQWLVDSDNEGTAEATQASFEVQVKEARQFLQQRRDAKKNDECDEEAKAAETEAPDIEIERNEIDKGYYGDDEENYDEDYDEEYEEDYEEDYEGDYEGDYDEEYDEYYDEEEHDSNNGEGNDGEGMSYEMAGMVRNEPMEEDAREEA